MGIFQAVKRYVKKKRSSKMKNAPKRGKSVRNGNMPSPYTKYNKTPYRYSFKTAKVIDVNFGDKQKEEYATKKKIKRAA